MSDLRVTNLKGRTPGAAPILPDGAVVTGVVTATTFSGNLTGTASTASFATTSFGLSGTPSISVTGVNASGVITATTFFGNLTGTASTASFATTSFGLSGNPSISVTGINASGISTFTNGPILIGSGTSTGTASQRLQVTGDAYVSGNLGIGTTQPAAKLNVVDSGASGSVIRSRVTTNNGGYLAYEALNSSGTSVFSVTHNGRINLSENIVFASGQGLDFSATADGSGTMTSELLSDYEEGTWTPTIIGSTTTGTVSYSNRNARYTKIGRQVFVETYINWSGGSGGSGGLNVYGLPFTTANVQIYPTLSIGWWDAIAFSGSQVLALFGNAATYIYFHGVPTNGGTNVAVPWDSAGAMILSGSYTI
jgi:hypothetical protein